MPTVRYLLSDFRGCFVSAKITSLTPKRDTRTIDAIILKLRPEVKAIIVVTVVVVTVEIMADNHTPFSVMRL
jgi:hypothetical protein